LVSYAQFVPPPLLACPFCRELYSKGETDGACPECGVKLEPLDQLPPSLQALAEDAETGELVAAEDRPLPWKHLGRGRGGLLAVAVAGIIAFFLPWVELVSPYTQSISGFGMAARGASWLWGGAAAWFVLIPLVVSRRTIRQMRGVRAISILFAAMTAAEILMLLLMPPKQHHHVTFEYSFAWGLYLSALLSVVGAWFAARLGGRVDDVEAIPYTDGAGRQQVESSDGQVLH
jgi:hypothetical protein